MMTTARETRVRTETEGSTRGLDLVARTEGPKTDIAETEAKIETEITRRETRMVSQSAARLLRMRTRVGSILSRNRPYELRREKEDDCSLAR